MLSPVVSKVTTKIYEVNYSGVISTSVADFLLLRRVLAHPSGRAL